jgi:hypothetical protein
MPCSEAEIWTLIHFALLPQAPSNMKSVLQAGWLLTVAFGNIIVLIVAGAGQISKQVRGGKEIGGASLLPMNGHCHNPPRCLETSGHWLMTRSSCQRNHTGLLPIAS